MQNFEPIFANDGYRPNVGIILCNAHGHVFWARRVKQDGWQFPQGGVARHESLLEAMYRELEEETGVLPCHVKLIAHTKRWLKYDLPEHMLRNQRRSPMRRTRKDQKQFKGQKQVWFLLRLNGDDSAVNLASGEHKPEFDRWEWVEREFAINNIVGFKRQVYVHALTELEPHFPSTPSLDERVLCDS